MNFDGQYKPKLKDYVYFVPSRPHVQVRWGEHALSISNEAAAELTMNLITFLDGNHTIKELVSRLPWDRKDILDVLTFLHDNGLLEDASIVSPFSPEQEKRLADQILYFSRFSSDKYELQEAISRVRTLVLGEGILFQEVLSSCQKAGMCYVAAAGDGSEKFLEPYVLHEAPTDKADVESLVEKTSADTVIVATLKPFSPLFSWANSVCLSSKTLFTSCTVCGELGLVGPTVISGQTPCYTCYELRKKSNLVFYDEFTHFEKYVGEHPELLKSDGAPINMLSVLANVTVLEVMKIVTRIGTAQTAGGQISFNPLTMEMKVHPILKLPRCPDCGLPSKEKRTAKVWMK
jgi:bacteriocin biosynthesis cyclodehydratase domain-containing protein